MVYLDTAASYPLLPEVQDSLNDAFRNYYANSASSHLLGEDVNNQIKSVREQLADDIGAYPSEIIFTSGATESNNIAFKSILFGGEVAKDKKHIITTQIEHKCVLAICDYLNNVGYEITYVKPNAEGVVEASVIKSEIRHDTALVSIMHVNNELGTVNPISEIGAVCLEAGVLFHSDAAQSLKKVPIDVDDLNVDVMSFSAHKIGGPKGIGAVYIRDLRKKKLMPVIHGAGQEEGIRGGTVAAPLIIGFGKALESFSKNYDEFLTIGAKKQLIALLEKERIPFILNGGKSALLSICSITFPNTNTVLLSREYEKEFCLAQGSACSSKEIEASHVLSALGISRELAEKTFRLSFPLDIKLADIDRLIKAIKKATNN